MSAEVTNVVVCMLTPVEELLLLQRQVCLAEGYIPYFYLSSP